MAEGERQYILAPHASHHTTHHTHTYGSAGTSPKAASLIMRHDVRSTDTLQSIAVHYNVTVTEIERANKMFPGESIHVRKHLTIPVNEKPRHSQGVDQNDPSNTPHTTSPLKQQDKPKTAHDFLSQFDAKFSQTKNSLDKVLSNKPQPLSNPTSPRTSPSSGRRTTLQSIHSVQLPPSAQTSLSPTSAPRTIKARVAWVEPALEVDSNNTLSNDDLFEL